MKMLSQAGIQNTAEGQPPDAPAPSNRDVVPFVIRSCYNFFGPPKNSCEVARVYICLT